VSLGAGLLRDLGTCCNRYDASIQALRHPELEPHSKRARDTLASILEGVESALADGSPGELNLAAIAACGGRVKLFRQTLFPFFVHYGRDERFLTLLAAQISEEVGCPIPTPIVGTFSDRGYWTVPELRALCVPAGEGHQLLALPDLVHELGHILFAELGQELSAGFIRDNLAPYIQSLEDRELAQRLYVQYRPWHVEFVADCVATYVCGPPYGWQHIRLGTQAGAIPARVWQPAEPGADARTVTHPSDAARMAVILSVLRSSGEAEGAERLEVEWASVTADAGAAPERFAVTYPDALLSAMAEATVDWCRTTGLVPFGASDDEAVVRHIADAWQRQLSDPAAFAAEEATRVRRLRRLVKAVAADEDEG
jgi:hypothetical protein